MKKDLVSLVSAQTGDFVLDMGCGEGDNTAKLWEAGYSVMGTDADKAAIEKAKAKYPNISFSPIDPKVFVTDGGADAIFSSGYAHKVKREDQETLLKRFEFMLADGGELVMELPAEGYLGEVYGGLEKAFAEEGLKYECPLYLPTLGEYTALLEACGFDVEFAATVKREMEFSSADEIEAFVEEILNKELSGLDKETAERMLFSALIYCVPIFKYSLQGVYLRIKARVRRPSMKRINEAMYEVNPHFFHDLLAENMYDPNKGE